MTATTSLREAATMALEALEGVTAYTALLDDFTMTAASESLEALRAALALPDAEPVAWLALNDADAYEGPYSIVDGGEPQCTKDLLKAFPVYATPVERKPLTSDAIELLYMESDLDFMSSDDIEAAEKFARAIEQAHGIQGAA